MIEQALLATVAMTYGQFRHESGHHGDVWLELEKLLVDARRVWQAGRAATRDQPPLVGYIRAHVSDPFGNRLEFLEAVAE